MHTCMMEYTGTHKHTHKQLPSPFSLLGEHSTLIDDKEVTKISAAI